MKLKTSAIAVAVAGTLATPMAVQAEGSVYASARVGVENVDGRIDSTGESISDLRTRSFGSRFGARGETDLGNGMTAFGRYEWDVDFKDHGEDVTDRGGSNVVNSGSLDDGDKDDIDVRLRYVGVKGDFGSVRLGQDYHTYYNFINAPVDNPWWASGYKMVNYRSRTDNGVTYTGGAGMFNFGATAYFARDTEEEAPDQLEAAVSFGIGDMTLGIGVQTVPSDFSQGSAANDETIAGVTLSGIAIGDASLSVNFESQDDDSSVVLDLGIGGFIVHYEVLDSDAGDNDPSLIMAGYTHNLGRGTALWGEVVSIDADTSDSDDDTTIVRVVLKYDIL